MNNSFDSETSPSPEFQPLSNQTEDHIPEEQEERTSNAEEDQAGGTSQISRERPYSHGGAFVDRLKRQTEN